MSINLSIPEETIDRELKPKITVVGVGGAGGNAVNDMITEKLAGVDFLVVNTDAQSLKGSSSERRVQMGASITSGLGAGASPEIGRAAAEESLTEIMEHLEGANMVFIAAGMGGGTGTGGAPVIAQAAREKGILTVGVVTKPFHFEGTHRMRLAEQGIEELSQFVDTLIVIPNQNLFRVANEKTTFADAFRMADEVLYSGVRGVTDLILMPGMINLDFADIRTVMHEMGKAMMGTGEAEGERRALDAAEAAIANPLLDDSSMKGARGVLINITGGSDMTLFEVDEAANRIRSEVDEDAYIIFGSAFEDNLEGKIRVSVVATGIDSGKAITPVPLPQRQDRTVMASSPVDNTQVAGAPEILRVEDVVTDTVEQFTEETVVKAGPKSAAETALESVFANAEDALEMIEETQQKPLPFSASQGSDDTQVETSQEDTAELDDVPDVIEKQVDIMTASGSPSSAPMAEMPVAVTDKPEAMPGAQASDPFIPPVPAVANGKEEMPPSKPFAESEFINGANEPAAVTSSAAVKKPVIKRAGSLFKTILGANKAKTVSQPVDWQDKAKVAPAATAATAAPVAPAAMAAPAATAATAPTMPASRFGPSPASGNVISSTSGMAQANLDVVEQPDRYSLNDQEDDLLDIPAFLRRQAN